MRLLSKHSFPTESLRISHCRCYKTFYLERDTFKVDPLVSQISSHNNSAGGCRWTDSCLFRQEETADIQREVCLHSRQDSGLLFGRSSLFWPWWRQKLQEAAWNKKKKNLGSRWAEFWRKGGSLEKRRSLSALPSILQRESSQRNSIRYFLIDNIYVVLS